jgi:hypothetical protein
MVEADGNSFRGYAKSLDGLEDLRSVDRPEDHPFIVSGARTNTKARRNPLDVAYCLDFGEVALGGFPDWYQLV